jgi:hypothetical protein
MKSLVLKSKSEPNPTLGGICKDFYGMLLRRFEQKKVVYLCFNPELKTKNQIRKTSVITLTLETLNHVLVRF